MAQKRSFPVTGRNRFIPSCWFESVALHSLPPFWQHSILTLEAKVQAKTKYLFFAYCGAVFELLVRELTHNLTQNRKFPCGINGAASMKGGQNSE